MGALELRPPPSVRRQRRRISCRRSQARAASREALLGGWRVNAIFIAQSGAPFTVNLGVDQANIGAGPAQRPDQLRDPNLPAASARPSAGSTRRRSRCRRRSRSAARRATASSGPGYANVDLALAKTWTRARRRRSSSCAGRSSTLLNRANFDLPNRIFGTPNFGRIFSAKNPREMQFGARLTF